MTSCASCREPVVLPAGSRPRVVEFCSECAAVPDDEITAEHYWAIGGSD